MPDLTLPQFLDLKISNMTTFQDLHISFKKGINVIFGGNYSGKTTIINSLRFGVFGLTWGHTIEGIEKRYFSSRVVEIERKSLDIRTVYHVKPMTVSIRRTVFSSGTADVEAKVSKSIGKSLSKSVRNIDREKLYHDALSKYMGLTGDELLKFIPSLIFADENRQLILWKKNLEDLVLSLIISGKNANKLRQIESQLHKVEDELNKLKQDRDRILQRTADKQRIQKFLRERLKEIEDVKTARHIEEYNKINSGLQKQKNKLTQINNEFQTNILKRSDLLLQLNNGQKAVHDLEAKSEQLLGNYIRAILNPTSPEEVHINRYLYHKKECPYCLTDLSDEINHRIESRMCLFCGQGPMITYKGDMEEIKQQLSDLDVEKKKLIKSFSKNQADLDQINEETERLEKSREAERIKESALSVKKDGLKEIEEQLHKKEIISRELKETQEQIKHNESSIEKNDGIIRKITTEIDGLNQLYEKAKMAMRTEVDSLLTKIKEKFSFFINLASNGEVSGTLSQDFVPILNGRTIFYPEFASQFERSIMDYAFRIALLSVFAEKTKTIPSLVIETPDEVADESYIPYLAKALLNFSSTLSIIVTTGDTDLMKQLLNNYKLSERKNRLMNLVSKGTLTQRKFYQTPLNVYLSENL